MQLFYHLSVLCYFITNLKLNAISAALVIEFLACAGINLSFKWYLDIYRKQMQLKRLGTFGEITKLLFSANQSRFIVSHDFLIVRTNQAARKYFPSLKQTPRIYCDQEENLFNCLFFYYKMNQ